MLMYIERGFRSFYTFNTGSVGQRAAKLPVIKLWEWFNPGQIQIRAHCFRLGPGPSGKLFLRPPTLKASNFVDLWSTNPKFSALKNLNLLKKYIKNQEGSYNFRLGFALSNRLHLTKGLFTKGDFSVGPICMFILSCMIIWYLRVIILCDLILRTSIKINLLESIRMKKTNI